MFDIPNMSGVFAEPIIISENIIEMLLRNKDASDTTSRLRNRVLYADKVIQQAAYDNGLKFKIKLEGGEPGTGAASYSYYYRQQEGMLQTTESERTSYINSVAPVSLPDAPINLSAIMGNSIAIVSFESSGDQPITGYTVTSSPSGFTATGTSSPIAITGLTNGVEYTFTVTATNSAGTSEPSESVSGTPAELGTIDQFTTVGTTAWIAPSNVASITYLIVGGGGGSGGGFDTGGGGGGGGGMVLTGSIAVVPGASYSVVVGNGGTAGISIRSPVSEIPGGTGGSSSFGDILALGGGGGYASRQPLGLVNGNGGAAQISNTSAAGGGNGGGSSIGGNGGGGGGGGAGGPGSDNSGTTGGAGGAGVSSSISGSAVTYGAGGAGANGGTNSAGTAGTANRGNGAKGGGATSSADENGASGGSGIVIISY
jgi:Fibronectin type III domain